MAHEPSEHQRQRLAAVLARRRAREVERDAAGSAAAPLLLLQGRQFPFRFDRGELHVGGRSLIIHEVPNSDAGTALTVWDGVSTPCRTPGFVLDLVCRRPWCLRSSLSTPPASSCAAAACWSLELELVLWGWLQRCVVRARGPCLRVRQCGALSMRHAGIRTRRCRTCSAHGLAILP